MAKRVRKLTPDFLKNIIMEEARKLQRETVSPGEPTPIDKVKAEEVEADAFADSLAKDIDHVKALKLQERKLRYKLKKIREARAKLRKKITKRI